MFDVREAHSVASESVIQICSGELIVSMGYRIYSVSFSLRRISLERWPLTTLLLCLLE